MNKEEYTTFLNYDINMSPEVRECFEKLIKEYFELKEKYSKILDDVHDYRYETHAMKMTIINLCEYFGVKDEKGLQNIYLNKPYKIEDLKEGMWVWDDKHEDYKQISRAIKENNEIWCYGLYDEYRIGKFEENRFYPPSKANEGKQ